ncbi:DUF421 domain-containing protein [Jannaschia sp. LMIT008]|uniref:DUF421 domain-containing protein n=1 Tax=Jannaschia maritima TaxID=3032585 RepID=UPI0028112B5F|nr:YetF domain-containing protein [Jannaschia sp. LMIT008]
MPDIPDPLTPFVDAVLLIPLLIVMVRLAGLRSFAKMSAHDFVVTVATGSVVAATVLNAGTPWWMGALAVFALLGVQVLVGALRVRVPGFQRAMDNEPLILMRNGTMHDDALTKARMTRDDLRQKLRQAGAGDPAKVALVILETTGDVSVMTDEPRGTLVQEVRSTATA